MGDPYLMQPIPEAEPALLPIVLSGAAIMPLVQFVPAAGLARHGDYKFAEAIVAGQPIETYQARQVNGGPVRRDFTYIDDVVEGVMRVLSRPPQPNELRPSNAGLPPQTDAPLRVYNLGSHRPEPVSRLIDLLEELLARPALRREVPLPACELPDTFADIESLAADFDFRPVTPLKVGVREFVEWWCGWRSDTTPL